MPPAQTTPARRKRRSGCLWGCLGIVLSLVLVIAGVALWRWLVPPRSDNMQLGKLQPLHSEVLPPSGGKIVVQQPESAIDGLSIEVPENAYPQDTQVSVSARAIESHKLGPDFDPVTPLIQIDNGHGFAAEPMTVEIPIQIADDEFAMGFFYDELTGKLEGIPFVALTPSKITLLTSHFSDIVVSKVEKERLDQLSVDTGFRPGVDDWQFPNWGSIVSPGGHCAGQSISTMWYYAEERVKAGKPPLYGRFDNNDARSRTVDLWQDDSWGYRLASSVQRSVDWDALSRKTFNLMGAMDDGLTWYAFLYAMQVTGEPQYVAVGRYELDDQNQQVRRGHALVVYRAEQSKLYVADPNYPGQAGRTIPFGGLTFQPYASGASAAEIEVAGPRDYTEIRYMAKSALVDWERIRALYEAMLRGESGKDIFPGYVLQFFAGLDANGDEIWAQSPKVLELSEDQTAQAGEHLRGQLLAFLDMPANRPFRVQVYEGTQPSGAAQAGVNRIEMHQRLKPGVNDLGFYMLLEDSNANLQYDDFWRVKVIYGPVDLAGTWEGTWQVQDATNVMRYVEDILVRIILWLGLVEDEGQARAAAAESISEESSLYAVRTMRVEFQPPSAARPNRYPVRATYLNDAGEIEETSGEAIYDQGQVRLSFRHEDGSTFEYAADLEGIDNMAGDFSINAWGGVIKNALAGVCQLSRQSP